MTEYSYFWDGKVTGDATIAPYSGEEMRRVMRILFLADQTKSGLVAGLSSFTNFIDVQAASATVLRVYAGEAIVYGTAYLVDQVDVDVAKPNAGLYYYLLSLRCNIDAHTTRVVLSPPSTTTWPTPTQTAYYWDIPLRRIRVNTSGIEYIVKPTDEMIALNGVHLLKQRLRQGGASTHWNVPSAVGNITIGRGAKIQFGTAIWTGASASSGSVAITFPYAYTYFPLVFSTARTTDATLFLSFSTGVTNVLTTGCTLRWLTTAGEEQTSVKINWMAIGMLLEL